MVTEAQLRQGVGRRKVWGAVAAISEVLTRLDDESAVAWRPPEIHVCGDLTAALETLEEEGWVSRKRKRTTDESDEECASQERASAKRGDPANGGLRY